MYDEIREGVYSSHLQKEEQLLFSRKTCKKVCLFVVAVVIFLSSRSPLLLYNRHFTELLHHNIYNCQHVTTFSHPPSLPPSLPLCTFRKITAHRTLIVNRMRNRLKLNIYLLYLNHGTKAFQLVSKHPISSQWIANGSYTSPSRIIVLSFGPA